jgi:peptidoglycan/xylan/chitin deacetylase (PgdA/CDA1 family)
LEADLKFLRDNGYTSVVPQDLIDFVNDGKPLPEKPIMLTFDDGHYNNIHYGEPLLKQYGMKAVIFLVGTFTEQAERSEKVNKQNPAFSYITWVDAARMARSGVWDVQSHSWDLHNKGPRMGAGRRSNESVEQYKTALRKDFAKINDKLEKVTGRKPTAFAYPFGCVNPDADRVLQEAGCVVTFGTYEGVAKIRKGDPDSLLCLRRCLRGNAKTAANIVSDLGC